MGEPGDNVGLLLRGWKRDELERGPAKCHGIDPGMVREAAILIGDEHLEELRIDVGGARPQAPKPVPRGKGAQQPAVAIHHFRRDACGPFQRRRERPVRPEKAGHQHARRQGGGEGGDADGSNQPHYSAATTSMRPVAVRAKNCGRYMSSTWAAGWS